jgi:hypothetical protein
MAWQDYDNWRTEIPINSNFSRCASCESLVKSVNLNYKDFCERCAQKELENITDLENVIWEIIEKTGDKLDDIARRSGLNRTRVFRMKKEGGMRIYELKELMAGYGITFELLRWKLSDPKQKAPRG